MTARYSGNNPLSYTVSERSWGQPDPSQDLVEGLSPTLQVAPPAFYAGHTRRSSHIDPLSGNYIVDRQGNPLSPSVRNDPRAASTQGYPIDIFKKVAELQRVVNLQNQHINMLEVRLRHCVEQQGEDHLGL